MNIKNVLLIGGSGFVGGWIANRLSERGMRVVIPSRHRDHTKKATMMPTVYVVEADVHDPKILADLMKGMDAVINLVGILHDGSSGQPYGKRFAEAHVELPKKIVAAMKQTGVRRLVHLSALKASSDAPSGYLRSKAAGEAAVLAAAKELDVTIFRPSVIFGPGDAFLNKFASLLSLFRVLPLAGAKARFQPAYIGDVADVMVDCLTRSDTFGQTYELAGPRAYSLRELVDYVAKLSGRCAAVINLGSGLAGLQARILSLLPNPPLSPDNLRSMQIDNLTDGARNYPGWNPKSLESVAPGYLAKVKVKSRLDGFRSHAGRAGN